VTAIVLEIPINLIGLGDVRAWATVSLHGHAPEVQVSRWGLPLITHISAIFSVVAGLKLRSTLNEYRRCRLGFSGERAVGHHLNQLVGEPSRRRRRNRS
jgi:hypothetical protein